MRSDDGFEPGTLNPYVIGSAEVKAGDRLGYKVVVQVHEGYPAWTAYRGPTSWSDARVCAEGDAITQEVAEALFPTLALTDFQYYS